MANAEYCDLLDDVNVVWVRSKPHRGFKLKGKRWQNKGRKLPVPTALMDKLRDRMIAKDAKPGDLIFPNTIGGVEGHFLRKLRAIAERAGVPFCAPRHSPALCFIYHCAQMRRTLAHFFALK